MSRPPRARGKVLDSARRIVREEGASHLTFERVAEKAGVTRAGVHYHYRSKQDLLEALLQADIEAWDADCRERADSDCAEAACEVLGHVRTALAQVDNPELQGMAGILTAAAEDPGLLEVLRRHESKRFADWRWDDADRERLLLMLAAEGAFWRAVFGIFPERGGLAEDLLGRIESHLDGLAPPRGSESRSGS